MDDLLTCRVCLIMDVKMYSLLNSPLDKYYQLAFGVNPHLNTHELFTNVCVECATLIKKYYFFRDKCNRGQNILQDLLDSKKLLLTKKDIQSIDREQYDLKSTLSIALPQNVNIIHYTYDPEAPSIHTEFIKEEPSYQDCIQQDWDFSDDDSSTLKQIKKELDETRGSTEKTESKIVKERKNRRKVENQTPIKAKPSKRDKSKNNIKSDSPKRYAKSGPNTKRTKIVKSLDKEISQHFDVITRTLEEQKEEIKARESTVSYQRSSLKCTICFKAFVQQSTYQHHMRKHDPSSGHIVCDVCGFRFHSNGILHRHQLIHTHRFICKTCRQVCCTRNEAKVHRIWHTGVTFQCKYCLESFSHRSSYFSHVRLKHPSQHICNLCGYSYLSEAGLKQHKSAIHRDHKDRELTGPKCDKCDVQFLNKEAYDRHLVNSSNHTAGSDFTTSCRECGLTFREQDELKVHQRKEHPSAKRLMEWKYTDHNNSKWPKKCDYCSVVLENGRENWYHHQRDHRDEPYSYTLDRHYVCELCGQKFEKTGLLKDHIKDKHSTERPHACPHCPKTFSTLNKYRHHMLSHSDTRPYSCTTCLKAFKTSSHLQRHEKIHSGLRPHSCKYCHKTFGTTTARNLHVRSVHYKIPPPVSNNKLLRRALRAGD